MDITWGAGGLTSDLTTDLCCELATRGMNPMMHLTCTNMPRDKVDEALKFCSSNGIRNILALRGDPPVGKDEWKAVDRLCVRPRSRQVHQQDIPEQVLNHCCRIPRRTPKCAQAHRYGLLGSQDQYPPYWAAAQNAEGVWEGVSYQDWTSELLYLKAKVDAGAELITTQLFYDVELFLKFVQMRGALASAYLSSRVLCPSATRQLSTHDRFLQDCRPAYSR